MSSQTWRTPAIILACGCIIMCISFGIRAGFGLFLQPISLEHGWGREVFSFAIALQNLMWGALGAVAGGLADRYGPGRVVATGAICYILGLIGLAYIDTPLLLHLNSGLLLGGALGGTSFGIILAVSVAGHRRWTSRAVGAGLAVTTVLASFTGYLLPWDQLALWAVRVGTNMRGYRSLFDAALDRFVLIDGVEVGRVTVLRWPGVHGVVLGPALLALLLLAWRRHRLEPAPVME